MTFSRQAIWKPVSLSDDPLSSDADADDAYVGYGPS